MTTLSRFLAPFNNARQIATVTLMDKTTNQPVEARILQLHGGPGDILFLQKGVAQAEAKSLVPSVSGINLENHQEIAEGSFENSLSLLIAASQKEFIQGPIVLVALNKANELLGICLANLPRKLADGSEIHSPLKLEVAENKINSAKDSIKVTSTNWLVSLANDRLKGIGSSLLLAHRLVMPKTVQRIDTVSETAPYNNFSEPFYQKFGFVPCWDKLEDHRPIPWTPGNEAQMPQFSDPDFHGVPMTVAKATFDERSKNVQAQLQFKPTRFALPENLAQKAHFIPHSSS